MIIWVGWQSNDDNAYVLMKLCWFGAPRPYARVMAHRSFIVCCLPFTPPLQSATSSAVMSCDENTCTKICDTRRARKSDAQFPFATMPYCPGAPTC
eukprot:COSAG01_NODE_31674_length_593_cov_0.967611_1_plen_95_part_10